MSNHPTYHGEGQAIHVETDSNPTVQPLALHENSPAYSGATGAIISNENSPSGFDNTLISGPTSDVAVYRGVSPAIHVFGDSAPIEWPPIPPIKSCNCCSEIDDMTGDARGDCTDESSGNYVTVPVSLNTGWVPFRFSTLDTLPTVVESTVTMYPISPGPGLHGITGATRTAVVTPAHGTLSGTVSVTAGTSGFGIEYRIGVLGGGTIRLGMLYHPDTDRGYVLLEHKDDFGNPVQPQFYAALHGFGTGEVNPDVVTSMVGVFHWKLQHGPGEVSVKVWNSTEGETAFIVSSLTPLGSIGYLNVFDAFGLADGPLISSAIVWTYETWNGDAVPDGCEGCEDPDNPGFRLPDFVPGYMPTFRRQIGDPTTGLDSYICTLESAAMVLAWHTRGAIDVWGGELIPWCGKSEANIAGAGGSPGTTLDNARQAWVHYSQNLDVRSGQTWDDLYAALLEGRAVVLQGDYEEFSLAERCQDNLESNHAISVYPYQISDRLLVGDPICSNFKGFRISSLRDYAERLGVAVFGSTSPQKILFAVSRPWST